MPKMTPPADYAGLIQCTTPTMSGKSYVVEAGKDIDVDMRDRRFLEDMGFTPATTAATMTEHVVEHAAEHVETAHVDAVAPHVAAATAPAAPAVATVAPAVATAAPPAATVTPAATEPAK